MTQKDTLTRIYKNKDGSVKLFLTGDGKLIMMVTPFPFLIKFPVIHDREGLFRWFAGEMKSQKANNNNTLSAAEVARFITQMFNINSKKSSQKAINFKRCLEILLEMLQE